MPAEPIEGRDDSVLVAYGSYHVSFLLGAGALAVCLLAGFHYVLVEHSRLPGIGLNVLGQAERQMAQGDYEGALQQYRMAARISPWDRGTAERLARAMSSRGTSDAEAAAWRAVLVLDARNVEALLKVGQSLARAGRQEEAVDRFVQARALAPENVDIALSLGNALIDQGRSAAAVEAYRRALPQHASNAVLHNALGIAWVHEGRFDDAIAEFVTAASLSADPDIAENLERARRGIGPS
jgi:Flp pilus assembly protein TadD